MQRFQSFIDVFQGNPFGYADTKTHRDRPIGHKFQMTQFKLAEMAAKVAAISAQVVMGSLDIQRVIVAKRLLEKGSCR